MDNVISQTIQFPFKYSFRDIHSLCKCKLLMHFCNFTQDVCLSLCFIMVGPYVLHPNGTQGQSSVHYLLKQGCALSWVIWQNTDGVFGLTTQETQHGIFLEIIIRKEKELHRATWKYCVLHVQSIQLYWILLISVDLLKFLASWKTEKIRRGVSPDNHPRRRMCIRAWLWCGHNFCTHLYKKNISKEVPNTTFSVPKWQVTVTYGHMWQSPLHPHPLWPCCWSAQSHAGGTWHSRHSSSGTSHLPDMCCPEKAQSLSKQQATLMKVKVHCSQQITCTGNPFHYTKGLLVLDTNYITSMLIRLRTCAWFGHYSAGFPTLVSWLEWDF